MCVAPVLKSLPQLNSLSLYELDNLQSLEGLKSLPQLNSLSLNSLDNLQSLEVLRNLPQLNSLSIYSLPEMGMQHQSYKFESSEEVQKFFDEFGI